MTRLRPPTAGVDSHQYPQAAQSDDHRDQFVHTHSPCAKSATLSPAAVTRLVARCGRLMIRAESYDLRLHWWYRLRHYAGRRR